MTPMSDPDVSERLGRLEAEFAAVTRDVGEIKTALGTIQDAVMRGQRTNWPVMIGASALLLSLWAAAIRPLDNDLIRQQVSAERLATAVLIQNDKIASAEREATRQLVLIQTVIADVTYMREHGTPSADRRLALLEQKMGVK